MLKIGEKIKSLRKEQDVTQEKLATYLNISYQAVSKWEKGTALPDITLIPRIANFFGVSADELLGMKDTEEAEELRELEQIYHENNRLGKTFDNITLSRKVLEKYPRNYQWMLNLAYPLTQYYDTAEHRKYSEEHNFRDESIRLCERVLEDCTVESIRHGAIQILCYEYPNVGKKDLALKMAMEMPDMYLSREQLLAHIYEGEEQIETLQHILLQYLEQSAGIIWMLTSDMLMGKELTTAQKIECMEIAVNLLGFVFKDDADIKGHNHTFVMHYLSLSKLWCKEGNADKAMETLLQAEKSARNYDSWASSSEKTKYRSVLINRCVSNPNGVGKNYEETELDIFRKEIQYKQFDLIRNTEAFQQLLSRL